MAKLPVRKPLPLNLERLSRIGHADGRLGPRRDKGEGFELGVMRGGRRGGIAVY